MFKERTLKARIKLARARARRGYIKAHNGHELPSWVEIHHVNFCPLDNSPSNWKALNRCVHIDLHSDDGDNHRSNKALSDYLDGELERELNELTLLCNVHNSEYGKYETAYLTRERKK